MKYYCDPSGNLFFGYSNIGYLLGFDGEKVYQIYKDGSKKLHTNNAKEVFYDWQKKGYIKDVIDKWIKEFGLIKNTFYIPKSGKPFSVKVGGEFSKYVWEKKENGDWEPAMIEGADYDVIYEANSERAQTFDKKVESGLWIKAEVEEK